MGDLFPNGGTNVDAQTYPDQVVTVGADGETLVNKPDGSLNFTPSAGSIINIYGNLDNSGAVAVIPTVSGAGARVTLGTSHPPTAHPLPTATFTQTGGSIIIKDLSTTSPASPPTSFPTDYNTIVDLSYASINNDADSLIDIETNGKLSVNELDDAFAVTYMNNAGTIKFQSSGGESIYLGSQSQEGHLSNFTNSGTIDFIDTKSLGTVLLNFSSANNSGELNFKGVGLSLQSYDSPSFTNDYTGKINISNGNMNIYSNFENKGVISVKNGSMYIDAESNLVNNGVINVDSSNLYISTYSSFPKNIDGEGVINISNGSNVHVGGSVSGQTFNLSGSGNILDFSSIGPTEQDDVPYKITGFSSGDELKFGGRLVNLSYDSYTGALTVTINNGEGVSIKLDPGLTGSFVNISGRLDEDTSFVYKPAAICFVSGSRICTLLGEKPVETLDPIDFVVSASGSARRIVWLGHRTFDCSSYVSPETVWPYRIRAHAFGENLPARDLWLSPDHAVMVPLLSEVLIPIKHLDNGATIAQVPVDEVTYWHVELESHDVLLAENLPAESFLDTLGRDFFGKDGFEQDKASFTTKAGRPHLKKWEADACRPLVTEGAIVAAAREMLLARAQELGWTKTQEADLHMLADGVRIEGRRLSETTIRFTFPAATRDLQLASGSFVPRHGDVATLDERRLGVPVAGLVLRHQRGGLAKILGLGTSIGDAIALDGPGLIAGFHHAQEWEGRRWRWTDGRARLSSALWAGQTGMLTLEVELAPERGAAQVWVDVPSMPVSYEMSQYG